MEGIAPAFGGELPDEALRVRGDPHQDVLEVVERRDVDQFAALDERVEHRGPSRPFEAPGE